jgi:predicted SprT family Zn-dependent metalloprotease
MDEHSVINYTNWVLERARQIYGYIPPVQISFYDKGHSAGMAFVKGDNYGVKYSREAMSKSENEAKLTISHELAHIVCFYKYRNFKHNDQWKHICRTLGGNGKSRCNLKLTPTRIHLYFQYLLDSGEIVWMGKNRHTKIQSGIEYKTKKSRESITRDHYTGKISNRLALDNAS